MDESIYKDEDEVMREFSCEVLREAIGIFAGSDRHGKPIWKSIFNIGNNSIDESIKYWETRNKRMKHRIQDSQSMQNEREMRCPSFFGHEIGKVKQVFRYIWDALLSTRNEPNRAAVSTSGSITR